MVCILKELLRRWWEYVLRYELPDHDEKLPEEEG